MLTNDAGIVPDDGPHSITVPAAAFKQGGANPTRLSVAVLSCRGATDTDCATFNDNNKTDCPDSDGGGAPFGV